MRPSKKCSSSKGWQSKPAVTLMRLLFTFATVLALAIFLVPIALAATCGDGKCESGETKCSCMTDCGECKGEVSGKDCMYYTCIDQACVPLMKFPCCGNGVCEATEKFQNCPRDCAPRSVLVEPQVDEKTELLRGETALIKAKIYADGDIVPKIADVFATGFFGELQLYDDGNHSDGTTRDGIYANTFLIDRSSTKGENKINLRATVGGVADSKQATLKVNPTLDISIQLEKEFFSLGEFLRFSGSLKKRGEPIDSNVTVSLSSGGKQFFSKVISPDKNGNFSFEHHTSLADPAGEWTVSLSTFDKFYNEGLLAKKMRVLSPEAGIFFLIDFIEPSKKAISRGEQMTVIVKVSDIEGKSVNTADVFIELPDKSTVSLKEVSAGVYSGVFAIPVDMQLGDQQLSVKASKAFGNITEHGAASTTIFVNKVPLTLEVLSPKESIFNLGETIYLKFKLLYGVGKPVEGAKLELEYQGKKFRASDEGSGIYTHKLKLVDVNFTELSIKVSADDSKSNTAEKELFFTIKQTYTPISFFLKDPLTTIGISAVALIALLLISIFSYTAIHLSALEKRKSELTELKRKLQESYFNLKTINTDQYKKASDNYSTELNRINAEITSIKMQKQDLKDKITQTFGKFKK